MKRAAETPELTDGEEMKVQESGSEIETERDVRRDRDHEDNTKTAGAAEKSRLWCCNVSALRLRDKVFRSWRRNYPWTH